MVSDYSFVQPVAIYRAGLIGQSSFSTKTIYYFLLPIGVMAWDSGVEAPGAVQQMNRSGSRCPFVGPEILIGELVRTHLLHHLFKGLWMIGKYASS